MSQTYAIPNSVTPESRLIPLKRPNATRTVRIAANVSMPVQVQASLGIAGCGDPRGSNLTLEGAILLPGVSAMVTFARKSSEENGYREGIASEAMLIAPGEWLTAASSSPPLHIARNSPLQIQIRDTSGAPLAEACNLGRWVDQPRGFCLSVRLPATLVAEVTTEGSNSNHGSRTTIGGRIVFGRGVLIRCVFGEGGESWGSHLCGVGKADIVAIDTGQTVLFPTQLVEPSGPAGSLQRMTFRDGLGHPFAPNGLYCA